MAKLFAEILVCPYNPKTKSVKFGYADDLVLLIQFNNFEDGEKILEDDLSVLSKYYTTWRLKPSPEKQKFPCFILIID